LHGLGRVMAVAIDNHFSLPLNLYFDGQVLIALFQKKFVAIGVKPTSLGPMGGGGR